MLLPTLGGVYEMALEMIEFIDSRLFASRWNGPVPEYKVLVADVSIPSMAFAHRETQPNTIAYGSSSVKMLALAANCWRYFSALEGGAEVRASSTSSR